jgi:pimeloyl-ACP methyl ester carboxylesterase
MTSGVIAVDGGELSYEVRGAGSPVVLLHGGLLDSRMRDAQFADLAQRHTVVRYDAVGHGSSSTPTARFHPHDDLDQLLTGLDIPRAALVALVGDQDSCDIDDVANLVCAGAEEARKVVVPGAGHMINMEAPEAFAREPAFLGP